MKRMKEYVMKGVNSGFCSSVCSSDFEHSVENHSKNVYDVIDSVRHFGSNRSGLCTIQDRPIDKNSRRRKY